MSDSLTIFNAETGTVVIDGHEYTAEEYEHLAKKVTEHLMKARAAQPIRKSTVHTDTQHR